MGAFVFANVKNTGRSSELFSPRRRAHRDGHDVAVAMM